MAQLRETYVEQPLATRLPPRHAQFDEIMRRHRAAVEAGDPCYDDPVTGLSVFTAGFLAARGYCCESGCRHCPYIVHS